MLGLMKRKIRIGAAWLGATALSVLIASAAVAGIRDRVVETPVALGLPTTTSTTVPLDPSTSTTIADVPTTALPSTTSTTTSTTEPPDVTVTTVAGSPVTTTTEPPAATTTTTAPPQTTTTFAVTHKTYDMVGGTVILAIGDSEVTLVSATPRPGFSADYEHTGPDEVEIKFVSGDHKSKLEAHWEDGELKVDIDEESDDDDDDDSESDSQDD